MPRAERQLFPERSALDRFGYELRTWRQTRGLSLDRLGRAVHVSGDLLGKIEVADRRPTEQLAKRCDGVLSADGALVRAWEEYDRERQQVRQQRAHADRFRVGIGMSVPPGAAMSEVSILHPVGTAREIVPPAMGAEIAADSMVGVPGWGDRIIIPCQASDGRIIWMSVPRRAFLLGGIGAVGAASVGAGMPSNRALEALSAKFFSTESSPFEYWRSIRKLFVDTDNLLGARNVIPAAYEQMNSMLRLGESMRGADYSRLLQVQVEFANLLAWLHQDGRDYRESQYWLDRALEWSCAGDDSETTAIILARKSQLACDMGESATALGLAEATKRHARPDGPAASFAATYTAHGYALSGDHSACFRAYDLAREKAAIVADDRPYEWSLNTREKQFVTWYAQSMSVIGSNERAAEAFGDLLNTLPPTLRRGRGVRLAQKAHVHVAAGEVEEAIAAGVQSLNIGAETGSARIANELARLNSALSPWQSSSSVAEFQSAVREVGAARAGASA